MSLSTVFAEKALRQEKVFVGYLTAGDPNPEASCAQIAALSRAGADVIELGVPHTDPIADGVTNAKAAERALRHGGGMRSTLKIATELREQGVTTPFVLFTYLNPILRMGFMKFAQSAVSSGITGVLVVDLPPEESETYCAVMKEHGLDTVFLVSPTTSPERLKVINRLSTGFVYYVCLAGVTGARTSLPPNLGEEVKQLCLKLNLPVCVGFGISTCEQVREVAKWADGVVVGSALVRGNEADDSEKNILENLEKLTQRLVGALPVKGVFQC